MSSARPCKYFSRQIAAERFFVLERQFAVSFVRNLTPYITRDQCQRALFLRFQFVLIERVRCTSCVVQ
jgi:hypothetical protein